MRYYIYISDSKVDMLLPQIPGAHKVSLAAKLGFDLKVLSGSLESQRETLDSRVARLHAVEDYLLREVPIGSPASRSSWIFGTTKMAMIANFEGSVLFKAEGEGWRLGLCGSSRHILGAPPSDSSYGHSLPESFEEALDALRENYKSSFLDDAKSAPPEGLAPTRDWEADAWWKTLSEIVQEARPSTQHMAFLAKRFATHQLTDGNVFTIGSPLFVALSDQGDDDDEAAAIEGLLSDRADSSALDEVAAEGLRGLFLRLWRSSTLKSAP